MEKQIAKSYKKPVLVTLGTAKELTKNFNQVGGGDAIFSVLLHAS